MTRTSKSRGIRPDYCFRRILDIKPEWLAERGIKGLLLDIDNTITRWEHHHVPPEEMGWLAQICAAGITCRLLSNGLRRKKVAVAEQTGLEHVSGMFVKPFTQAFRQGLEDLALDPAEVMMIGDSVITDIYAANHVGIWTALVDPLSPVDFIGSKFYRLVEKLLCLRHPVHAAGDYRHAHREGRPG